ncbi:membrane-bound serine protease (ClpP class) [Thermodesulfobium acidiphilum]|uniref:Membrane-bound serine protease (ClpP class) n=1 Tax=Thermodesulfobium acidiphilum TaxID=1794699 RepID=A0A2R4W2P0_THEAF|nr:membrane-bound serine protease (ClpP class) [Thermodesulfobium acidiphilum]
MVLHVNGAIDPVIARYVKSGIESANNKNMSLVVIELDTPGGLDQSMREIVQSILKSKVPVASFVYPSGARAASAGTFIVEASSLAVMSPNTSIGAAHPVMIGGGNDKTLLEKATQDAASYIRSLAKIHGRNENWAQSAVLNSQSLNDSEAIKEGVIDIVAKDLDSLVSQANGRTVIADNNKIVLNLEPNFVYYKMSFFENFLHLISNPTVASILMMVGIYGIIFELASPGLIFPGIIGFICVVLSFFALGNLPFNITGLLFVGFAVILFVTEIFVSSFGILTIGGIISLVFGMFMIFEPSERLGYPSVLTVVIPAAILTGLLIAILFYLVLGTRRKKPFIDSSYLIDKEAEVKDVRDGAKLLLVFFDGELWSAKPIDDQVYKVGDTVRIVGKEGIVLKVKRT